jgi:hypothetical protein
VINRTKAKILETMAPTPSTLKRPTVLPTRVVKKAKGGTGRRRTPTDSGDEEDPVVSPYKWSTSTTKVKQTKGGPSTISTRATAITADTVGQTSAVTMLSQSMNNKEVHVTDEDKGQKPLTSFMHKHKNITCYKCGKKGHYATKFPDGDNDDEASTRSSLSNNSNRSNNRIGWSS